MTAGEATREYYREQGRKQERQRMTETEAIRENYNLGVLAGEARERQRVTNLIEFLVAYAVLLEDDADGDIQTMEAKDLIALIKGEK
jgi:alpha-D-ribose 1-methylphosphonate 5-triphosphate synthase subunit PhnL